MTPAELVAWAARMEDRAAWNEREFRELSWYSPLRDSYEKGIADLRLAARLARFAAERGGLEEEGSDGK